MDSGSGKAYFWHLVTNEVCWTPPEGLDGDNLIAADALQAAQQAQPGDVQPGDAAMPATDAVPSSPLEGKDAAASTSDKHSAEGAFKVAGSSLEGVQPNDANESKESAIDKAKADDAAMAEAGEQAVAVAAAAGMGGERLGVLTPEPETVVASDKAAPVDQLAAGLGSKEASPQPADGEGTFGSATAGTTAATPAGSATLPDPVHDAAHDPVHDAALVKEPYACAHDTADVRVDAILATATASIAADLAPRIAGGLAATSVEPRTGKAVKAPASSTDKYNAPSAAAAPAAAPSLVQPSLLAPSAAVAGPAASAPAPVAGSESGVGPAFADALRARLLRAPRQAEVDRVFDAVMGEVAPAMTYYLQHLPALARLALEAEVRAR